MGVTELNNIQEYRDAIATEGKLVVIDCYANWCGPCKVISPKVEVFSNTYNDVEFYKMDVDEMTEASQELGVRAMPTFFFFRGGEKLSEVVGANPAAIEAAIEKNK